MKASSPEVTFFVGARSQAAPDTLVLTLRNWNDWYQYRTTFYVTYIDAEGARHDLGTTKIAKIDHTYVNAEGGETPLPRSFSELDGKRYVSVGQTAYYYESMREQFGPAVSRDILRRLSDMAESPERLDSFAESGVVRESLMREVPAATIRNKFRRIVETGEATAAYAFTFTQEASDPLLPSIELDFEVRPNSLPPTNVHALIGRNGSGKTTLLASIARTLLGEPLSRPGDGQLLTEDGNSLDVANLVYVSFSAFDEIHLPVLNKQLQWNIPYSYVGLRHIARQKAEPLGREVPEDLEARKATLRPADLREAFAESAHKLLEKGLRKTWKSALATLESDPNFAEENISRLARSSMDAGNIRAEARAIWEPLSTGHKIVLLTITRLVETVTERTLVLMDEPEGHLHPPLLSALVRALSSLLMAQNGVAIVATHSPVVLQEVPRRCAYKVGKGQKPMRPAIETFGEGVGILTSEVFSLEVVDAGYHRLLVDSMLELGSYEAVLEKFGHELGFEARALLRALSPVRADT